MIFQNSHPGSLMKPDNGGKKWRRNRVLGGMGNRTVYIRWIPLNVSLTIASITSIGLTILPCKFHRGALNLNASSMSTQTFLPLLVALIRNNSLGLLKRGLRFNGCSMPHSTSIEFAMCAETSFQGSGSLSCASEGFLSRYIEQ